MKKTVDKNLNERDQVAEESTQLRGEVDELNAEIEQLMAEDGQDYTPQVAPEAAAPQVQAQANNGAEAQAMQAPAQDAGSDGSNARC